ncbi:MAG TPA: adenylate/guanylate cyclase domain-containing protein [Geminicoccaceae bacterium]|nr:adenylate/guanylate cyclase domain-containing protein [Geminicoccaceae bacterium]
MSEPAAEPAILVVDDNDDNRYTLTRRLRRQGFNALTEAASGRQALEELAGQPFDLVLLDVMMPEMNGYEVLERLKADEKLRHIPVIMISALSELDSVVRCIELGAEDYLPKPFNTVLLNARIGASLERKRLHDRERAHLAEIDRQRQRADELLHAMLPGPAVEELKASDRVEPRRFNDVAVLFADVVDFTRYCDRNPPELVVANLDHLASTFEDITSAHGLEKIKTVGDAFMATANLLDPHADPVMASLRAAFDLAEAARRAPAGWRMRSGIHIGPVVAGVVGSRKFSFDLWGDTVNLAQRLSSLGSEPAVHLSAAAWARVAERASGDSLGELDVKGKGNVEVVRCRAIHG